ncbi:hypothetical protein ATN83_2205 [Raoultella ornithinolytica]|nr:hypothetical protein ATN83_2205 [Raoultella ornithinolytica]KDV93281.1 hypothetical protein AB00_2945 [Raoultella ornithinolytica 2-156-04_S1_C1]KDX15634.1 hypothetical protein AB28_1739 [Raoultella ornithinolytica 2-156-04_S1_C2]
MILLKSAAIRYKTPAKSKTEPTFSLKIKIPFHFKSETKPKGICLNLISAFR